VKTTSSWRFPNTRGGSGSSRGDGSGGAVRPLGGYQVKPRYPELASELVVGVQWSLDVHMVSMSSGSCKEDCRPLKFEFHARLSETHNTPGVFPVRSSALILIEAPSSAYHRGMLVVGKVLKKRRRPHAILHDPAPILLWHCSACPYHVRLYS
jgi:hypothetical protein